MRRIAVVGAGQAGLQIAFGLLAKGLEVTVYSDRTPEQIFAGRNMATAFMFDRALSYERELGLNFWDAEVPWCGGMRLDFCRVPGDLTFTVRGRFQRPGQAVDQRLKFARWLPEIERRGGKVIIGQVTRADLDDLAATNDLVLVATGKGELSNLFEPDLERCVHTTPRRTLGLINVTGYQPREDTDTYPVRYILTDRQGEIILQPFFDKTVGRSYAIFFAAWHGSLIDRFRGTKSGDEMIDRARQVIAQVAPFELDNMQNIELTDPLAWSVGQVTPTVRKAVGWTPAGVPVMGIGDAVILNDPITGQGSNCASKMAHFLTQRIVARGDLPFDEFWMQLQFERFWELDGRHITAFTNLFLEPAEGPAREVLLAATRSAEIADTFFDSFNNPQDFYPWITDLNEARRFIEEMSGAPWSMTTARARREVAREQLVRRRSIPPGSMSPRSLSPKSLSPNSMSAPSAPLAESLASSDSSSRNR